MNTSSLHLTINRIEPASHPHQQPSPKSGKIENGLLVVISLWPSGLWTGSRRDTCRMAIAIYLLLTHGSVREDGWVNYCFLQY